MAGGAGGYTRGDGMIAPENEWEKTFAQGFFNGGSDVATGFGNFLQILGAFFTYGQLFRLLDGEIADVFDLQSELLDTGLQARAAHSGGAHVHAAAALSQVHGHTDNSNFLRHCRLFPS